MASMRRYISSKQRGVLNEPHPKEQDIYSIFCGLSHKAQRNVTFLGNLFFLIKLFKGIQF
jgi:hypothetical protein